MHQLARQLDFLDHFQSVKAKTAVDSQTNQLPAILTVTNPKNCCCKLSLKASEEEEIGSSTSSLQPWS